VPALALLLLLAGLVLGRRSGQADSVAG